MKQLLRINLFVIVCLFMHAHVFGQAIPFFKRIHIVFRNIDMQAYNDSVPVYAFNFRIKLAPTKNGKVKVMNVTANDSSAYKMYPNYKMLYTTDFSPLVSNNKNITVVIPVICYKRPRPDGIKHPNIDVNQILNTSYALQSSLQYSNEKEDRVYFMHRVYRAEKRRDEKAGAGFEQIILVQPFITEILNIR